MPNISKLAKKAYQSLNEATAHPMNNIMTANKLAQARQTLDRRVSDLEALNSPTDAEQYVLDCIKMYINYNSAKCKNSLCADKASCCSNCVFK